MSLYWHHFYSPPARENNRVAHPHLPPKSKFTSQNRKQSPVTFSYIGQTEASQQVDVRARVQGVLWDQGFTEGTSVTAGQFLFRIDPRPFEADMQIAEAQAFQAKVGVQSAERGLGRTRRLTSSESVSREELDDATSVYETAVAALRLADAQLLKARLELSYTTVTAPIAGRIGRALKKPGDLVDDGENSLLCTITAQDPMFVNFSISEKDMLEYRTDKKSGRIVVPETDAFVVEIVMLDGTQYYSSGRINFSDVTIDPRTGTGLHRAAFPNPNNTLQPGQFVKVNIKGANRTETIMVPQGAVMMGMQGTYVYVVDDKQKVEMRPVTATDWEGHNWIIEDGLEAGENIIIAGINKTQPGADVKVTTVTKELALKAPAASKKNVEPAGDKTNVTTDTRGTARMPASPKANAEAEARTRNTTQSASATAKP